MAKKMRRRKKSLYEIIGGAGSKTSFNKTLEQLQQSESATDEKQAQWMPQKLTPWPKKPKFLQYNASRIELSIPYQLGIAVLLGVVLMVLVVFRLGQLASADRTKTEGPVAETPKEAPRTVQRPTVSELLVPRPVESTVPAPAIAEEAEQSVSTGSNRIVIQTYDLRSHLEPVKKFFSANGIETEIREIGGMYYLVTSRKYKNPERKGTDGYNIKQKIIEVGADYKAPPGYETFGRKPFHDAYGMRFDD